MIPTKSSWPFHPLLVQLAGEIEKVPAQLQKPAVVKTVERCFRLGVKLAMHYGMPGQTVLATFFGAMQEDGGDACMGASQEFAAAIATTAIADFKASIGYQEFAAVQKIVAGVTSKGGDA